MRALLLLSLAGCVPEFASVEEACPERVWGEAGADPVAAEAIRRAACHRRVAGIVKGTVSGKLSEAAAGHAAYFLQNGPDLGELQDPAAPGFTGRDYVERAENAGYDVPEHGSYGYWDGFALKEPGESPADVVDTLVADPYFRQIVLQTSLTHLAYGEADPYVVVSAFYEWPPDTRAGRPLVYPADGQVDVPTRFRVHGDIGDGLGGDVDRGYPITVFVGADEIRGGWQDVNPFEIALLDAALDGPSGPVDVVRIVPESTPAPMHGVAVVPREPLEPGATYTFTATVRWTEGKKDVVATFTTAE